MKTKSRIHYSAHHVVTGELNWSVEDVVAYQAFKVFPTEWCVWEEDILPYIEGIDIAGWTSMFNGLEKRGLAIGGRSTSPLLGLPALWVVLK